MGLTRSWAHENAEWSSAMLGHAGIRNGICQIIHLRPGVSQGEEGLAPRAFRHEDPEALVFASFFSSFHPAFRFEGGGVLGKRVAETPLPLHHSRDEIVGTPLH